MSRNRANSIEIITKYKIHVIWLTEIWPRYLHRTSVYLPVTSMTMHLMCVCAQCMHIQVTIRFDQIQLVRIAAVGCRHRWRRCTRWWRWWSSYRCRRRPISVLHRVRLVDLLCLGLDLHGCRLRRLLNLGVGLVQVCGTVGAGSRAGRLLLLCGCCGRRKHRVQDMIESVYLRWIGRDSNKKKGFA